MRRPRDEDWNRARVSPRWKPTASVLSTGPRRSAHRRVFRREASTASHRMRCPGSGKGSSVMSGSRQAGADRGLSLRSHRARPRQHAPTTGPPRTAGRMAGPCRSPVVLPLGGMAVHKALQPGSGRAWTHRAGRPSRRVITSMATAPGRGLTSAVPDSGIRHPAAGVLPGFPDSARAPVLPGPDRPSFQCSLPPDTGYSPTPGTSSCESPLLRVRPW